MPPGLSVLLNSKGQFLIAQGSARSGPKTGCAQMPIPRITPHNNIVFFRCLFRLMCYYYVLLAGRPCGVCSGPHGRGCSVSGSHALERQERNSNGAGKQHVR
jgi:hypothetical protein